MNTEDIDDIGDYEPLPLPPPPFSPASLAAAMFSDLSDVSPLSDLYWRTSRELDIAGVPYVDPEGGYFRLWERVAWLARTRPLPSEISRVESERDLSRLQCNILEHRLDEALENKQTVSNRVQTLELDVEILQAQLAELRRKTT